LFWKITNIHSNTRIVVATLECRKTNFANCDGGGGRVVGGGFLHAFHHNE